MKDFPIGILDSGTGGVSILQSVEKALPYENIIYIGDHAMLPYGTKPPNVVRNRVLSLLSFLLTKQIKLAIVACNTATVAGIDFYRTRFPDLPIVGVVPVVKTAVEHTKTGHIGIMATKRTLESSYEKKLEQRFGHSVRIVHIALTELVSMIENVDTSSEIIIDFLKSKLSHIPMHDVDVIALGCTHFPFVRKELQDVLGPTVEILDSGAAVARQVARILSKNNLLRSTISNRKPFEFYTTGDTSTVSKVISRIIEDDVVCRYVKFNH